MTKATTASSEIAPGVDTRTDAEKEADRAAAEAQRDEQGAALVKAEGEGAITTATGVVLTPSDTPVLEGEEADWAKVVIVSDAPERLPAHKDAKVIIAERRTQPDEQGLGAGGFDETAEYSGNGDAYVGYARVNEPGEAEAIFPKAKAPVFLMGQNVKQFGLGGLSRQAGYLSVGPAHPVYVAVNLAHQKGAKEVEITGLTDHDKAVLSPWLEKIKDEFENLSW